MTIDELFSLEGKTALVTGASAGIGLHVAELFAQAGAAVALAARRIEKTSAAAGRLAAAGHRACAVPLDVTRSASIAPAFDAAERALGAPVDILFNNAGILYAKRFVDQGEEESDRVFDTNLKGAFRVAQEAARRMSAQRRGSIINVASTAALRAGTLLSSYCASKAALVHLTRVMALELAGKNIRVNALCPGNIETDMQQVFADAGITEHLIQKTPQRRLGKPEDLDGICLLLASDAGAFMTGAVVPVDGGQTLTWM